MLGELLLEILREPQPPSRTLIRGVTVSLQRLPRYLDYLEVAFGQIIGASSSHEEVALTLERTLGSVGHELVRRGWGVLQRWPTSTRCWHGYGTPVQRVLAARVRIRPAEVDPPRW